MKESVGQILVRSAAADDLARIAAMANDLNVHHGGPDGIFDADALEVELFGPDAMLRCIVAARGPELVGYAFFHVHFNSDAARRGTWLVDLYVAPGLRSRGIGRKLLAAVAAEAEAAGHKSLWWDVDEGNSAARSFYALLGARDPGARILELDGEALLTLAALSRP